MSTIEKWRSNKHKIRIFGVIEVLGMLLSCDFAFKYGGEYTSSIFLGILVFVFGTHIAVLFSYWRCPSCKKLQPFWENHNKASVGSLTHCVYCSVPYG